MKGIYPAESFMKCNFRDKLRYIFLKNSIYIELKVMKMVIKFFRKRTNKRRTKVWVLFCCNHAWFRKKAKSRMGKGKGEYVRNVFRGSNCKPVLIFRNISKMRIIRFTRRLNMWFNKFHAFSSFNSRLKK